MIPATDRLRIAETMESAAECFTSNTYVSGLIQDLSEAAAKLREPMTLTPNWVKQADGSETWAMYEVRRGDKLWFAYCTDYTTGQPSMRVGRYAFESSDLAKQACLDQAKRILGLLIGGEK